MRIMESSSTNSEFCSLYMFWNIERNLGIIFEDVSFEDYKKANLISKRLGMSFKQAVRLYKEIKKDEQNISNL